ncbi:hypothetical protein A2U01_0094007, partial [Trifolium medium]|nr:hypothetical protein [Trifolium medium]
MQKINESDKTYLGLPPKQRLFGVTSLTHLLTSFVSETYDFLLH